MIPASPPRFSRADDITWCPSPTGGLAAAKLDENANANIIANASPRANASANANANANRLVADSHHFVSTSSGVSHRGMNEIKPMNERTDRLTDIT